MSRRKRIHGHKRTHRSPLPKIGGNRVLDVSSGADPTKVGDFVQGKLQKDITKKTAKRAVTSLAGSKLGTIAGNVAGGIGLAATLYDMWSTGQEEAGGRVGYTKNPNYVEGGPKHGDADSGAQFIPDPKSEVTKGKHTGSIWDKKKSDGSKKTSVWGKKKSIF